MANYFQAKSPQRQKLIRPLGRPDGAQEVVLEGTIAGGVMLEATAASITAKAPDAIKNFITTREELQNALVNAFRLELATVPPYMCGLYSIRDGTNQEAARLIRSVLVEEMLHMALVANMLNAISTPGEVAKLLTAKGVMADYPAKLPGNIVPKEPPDFRVPLLPLSTDAIEVFLTIERPGDPNAEPTSPGHFDSIGQFYQAVRWGFENLKDKGIYIGDVKRQITEEHYYGSGGKLLAISTPEHVDRAIEEIVGQGEGIDGTIHDPDSTLFGEGIEYAHYFKFQEIRCRRFYKENDTNQQAPVKSIPTGARFDVSYNTAHAMRPNPKVAHFTHDPTLQALAIAFNRLYTQLVQTTVNSANGDPAAMTRAIPFMHELRERAKALMNVPLGDGTFAGPTFEFTNP